jgi:hypothetical protein
LAEASLLWLAEDCSSLFCDAGEFMAFLVDAELEQNFKHIFDL